MPHIERWNPRGEPTWPEWKAAPAGTRVENVRTGRAGTFVKVGMPGHRNAYAVVDWDTGFRGRVVAPAFDLRPISEVTSP